MKTGPITGPGILGHAEPQNTLVSLVLASGGPNTALTTLPPAH